MWQLNQKYFSRNSAQRNKAFWAGNLNLDVEKQFHPSLTFASKGWAHKQMLDLELKCLPK